MSGQTRSGTAPDTVPGRPLRLSVRKRVGFSLALLALTGVLVLVLGEVSFRAWAAYDRQRAFASADYADDLWATYDPLLGYRLNPAFEDHNAAGLRDRPVPPRSARPRLLMLGDSLGYDGDSIDDTYVRYLETALRDGGPDGRDPIEIEVINASVMGYTTHQEILYLERDGVALDPDVVGLAFVLNDVHQFLHQFQHRDGRILRTNLYQFTDEASGQRPGWLDSLFLHWLVDQLQIGGTVAGVMAASGFPFEYKVDIGTAWKPERWGVVDEALERFRMLGREHGFEPFIVMFPMLLQYDEALLARDREYLLQPQNQLAERSTRLGIPFLDLYGEMRPEHFDDDGLHLSAEGRRAVAIPIADFLHREGLTAPLR